MSLAEQTLGDVRNDSSMLPPEEAPAFSYIARLTASLDSRFDLVEMKTFMADGKLITDEPEINKIVFEMRPTLPTPNYMDTSVKRLEEKAEILAKSSSMNYESMIKEQESSINYHSDLITARLRDIDNFRTEILKASDQIAAFKEAIKNQTTSPILDEIKKILDTGLWQIIRVGDDGKVVFASTDCIYQEQRNPAAGVDIRVNFGILCPVLNLSSKSLRVRKGMRNIMSNDHYHTHISTSGSICWGNYSDKMQEALRANRLLEVFNALHTLLSTYSHENPYVRLSHFDDVQKISAKVARVRGSYFEREFTHQPADLHLLLVDR